MKKIYKIYIAPLVAILVFLWPALITHASGVPYDSTCVPSTGSHSSTMPDASVDYPNNFGLVTVSAVVPATQIYNIGVAAYDGNCVGSVGYYDFGITTVSAPNDVVETVVDSINQQAQTLHVSLFDFTSG